MKVILKSEVGGQYHLTPLAAKTKSGLELKQWAQRLLVVRVKEGRTNGPAFSLPEGKTAWPTLYEREIIDHLVAVHAARPDLIPVEVQVLDEYGISRSVRRGATSETRARGVTPEDVPLTNRWRNFESAKGRHPRLTMRDHYLDKRLLIPPALLRFSINL